MDLESQKRLDEITGKEPAALSEADIEFLRARRDYLTQEQRAVFADILEAQSPSDSYADLSVAKLREIAVARGIEFEADAKKAQLIALLEDANAQNPQ